MARFQAGTAYVQVIPTLDDFHRKIQRETKKIKDAVKLPIDGDTSKLNQTVDRAKKSTKADKATLGVDGDTSSFDKTVNAAKNKASDTQLRLEVDADTREFNRKVNEAAHRAKVDAQRNAQLELDIFGNSSPAVDEAKDAQSRIGRMRAFIAVHINERAIHAATRAMHGFRRATVGATVAVAALAPVVAALNATHIQRTAAGMFRLLRGAILVGAAFSALATAIPVVGHIGAALVTASGAALMLPGILAAVGVAAATVAVGFHGMGDALKAAAEGDAKKLEEAMRKLAPAAQEAVRGILSLREAFQGVGQHIQGAMWQNMAGPLRQLAQYAPVVRDGMGGIAQAFNGVMLSVLGFANAQSTVRDFAALLGFTRTIVANLGAAVAPVLDAFRHLGVVGAEVFADMTRGAGSAAERFRDFMAHARETGKLHEWMRNGIEAIKGIIGVLVDLGSIVASIFRAANAEGTSLAGGLGVLIGEVARFLRSAEGQTFLRDIFRTINDTVRAMLPGLQSLGRALMDAFAEIGPVLPGVGQALGDVAAGAAPVVRWLGELLRVILPPLTAAISFLSPVLGPLILGLAGVAGAARGVKFVGGLVDDFHKVGAAMKILDGDSWKLTDGFTNLGKAAWGGQWGIKSIATGAWGAVAAIPRLIGQLVIWTATQWGLNIAMAANPLGLIVLGIAAVIAAIVLCIVYWDQIKAAIINAWNAIVEFLRPGLEWLGSVFAAVWGWISQVVSDAWNNWIFPVLDQIWYWIRFIGSIIVAVLVTPFVIAWELLKMAAIAAWEYVLRPVFEAIGAVASWLWHNVLAPVFGWIGQAWTNLCTGIGIFWNTVLRPVWDAIAGVARWLWDNVLAPVFGWIGQGWNNLLTGIKVFWDTVLRPVWDAIAGAARWLWDNVLSPVFGFIGRAWDNLLTGIKVFWDTVLKPVWDAVAFGARWLWENALKPVFDAIGKGWEALVNGIKWVWEHILKPIWDAFVGVWDKVKGAFGVGGPPPPGPAPRVLPPVEAFASGGFARVVPPNTPRLIGDRVTDDEAYIPINNSPRSQAILAETAKRMGYQLSKAGEQAAAMAAGGTVGKKKKDTGEDAPVENVAVDPEQINAATAALELLKTTAQTLNDEALLPLANQLTTGVMTAFTTLVQAVHAAVVPALQIVTNTVHAAVIPALLMVTNTVHAALNPALLAIVNMINGMVVPTLRFLGLENILLGNNTVALQMRMQQAWQLITQSITVAHQILTASQHAFANAMNMSWQFIATQVWASVNNQHTAFTSLHQGLAGVRDAMTATADWAHVQFRRVWDAASGPVRDVLHRVFNEGLIGAWNKLNHEFAFNKPVGPVAVPFATGGRVPGAGKRDTVPAMLTPGEYVLKQRAVQRIGVDTLDMLNNQLPAGMTRKQRGMYGDGGVIPGYAGGGLVWPMLWNIIRGRFPGAIKTSDYRPGEAGSYHGTGKAVDVAGGMPLMHDIQNWLIGTFGRNSAEIIGPTRHNIKNGRPLDYGPATTAQHMDHVHWAADGTPQQGGLPGFGIDPEAFIGPYFEGAYRAMDDIGRQWGANHMAGQAIGVSRQATDRVKAKAIEMFSSMGEGGGAGVERWRGLVMRALAMVGQPGSLVDVVLRRMNQESKGDPRAINNWDINSINGTPSKGLMQVIDPTFQAHRHPALPNDIWNPLSNIVASMRYTLATYGSLPAGYNRKGGYDQGGYLLPGRTLAYNNTGRRERVLDPIETRQWETFERGAAGNQITVNARTDASPDHIAKTVDRYTRFYSQIGGRS